MHTEHSLILNVDDNDGARYAKTRTLSRAGFTVIEAATGTQALERARAEQPALMLLDMKLPDIHGLEVCRILKSDPATHSILILQTSASYLASADKIRALEGGADNYLFEPIEPEELVANVKALLRLGRVERQLRESDRLKDEFLATLAHELRNPLAPIRNAVELMGRLRPDDIEQQGKARQTITRQTDHLVRLVDDLLDVSRINQGKIALKQDRVELRSFIDAALETSRPVMEKRKHTLTATLPDEPVWMLGDQVRLAQIVGNLLHNAAKFTPVGGRIELLAARQGNTLKITVRDNGIGISADSLASIFQLFSQAGHLPDRVQDGLGIGLSLVKQLIELHGGTVTVSSAGAGLGSEFELLLPLPPGQSAAVIAASGTAAIAAIDASSATAETRGPRRILVVDDSRDSADTMCAILESDHHALQTCYDGASAIATAQSFQPEIVLLDIGLPDMTGYEVARNLRAVPGLERITLIALTGYGQASDKQLAQEAGFDHHLVKPVNIDELENLIASIARRGH